MENWTALTLLTNGIVQRDSQVDDIVQRATFSVATRYESLVFLEFMKHIPCISKSLLLTLKIIEMNFRFASRKSLFAMAIMTVVIIRTNQIAVSSN